MFKKVALIMVCVFTFNCSANAFFTEAWEGTCNFCSDTWDGTCNFSSYLWNGCSDGCSSAYESSISWVDAERKDISTIIITSNYYKSRLLADLVQNRTGQPYILVPTDPSGKIFFCGNNADIPDLEIHPSNFMQFLTFINPKRIILLGDKTYVRPQYRKQIQKYFIPWNIDNVNWDVNSERIGAFFMDSTIPTEYREIKTKLEKTGGFYVPANPATKSELKLDTPPPISAREKIPAIAPLPIAQPVKQKFPIIVENNIQQDKEGIKFVQPVKEDVNNVSFDEPQIIIPDDDPILVK